MSERQHARRRSSGYGIFRLGLWANHSRNKSVRCRIGRSEEFITSEPAQFCVGRGSDGLFPIDRPGVETQWARLAAGWRRGVRCHSCCWPVLHLVRRTQARERPEHSHDGVPWHRIGSHDRAGSHVFHLCGNGKRHRHLGCGICQADRKRHYEHDDPSANVFLCRSHVRPRPAGPGPPSRDPGRRTATCGA